MKLSKNLLIRISPELLANLKKLAEYHDQSVSEFLRLLVKREIQNR